MREQGIVDDPLEKFGPEDTESVNRATDLTQGFLRGELGLAPVGSPALIGVVRIRSTQTWSCLDGRSLIWIGGSLWSNGCLRLCPPHPAVKTPPQVHFAQRPYPQNTPGRAIHPAARGSERPASLSSNPLGEERADSRTVLFTSFQMGY